MTPEQFRAWRKRHGLTQAQAAQHLGVGKRSIFTYESSGPIPQPIAIACEALSLRVVVNNYEQMLREQHPNISAIILVLPIRVDRDSAYPDVVQIRLSEEVTEWLAEHAPSARFQLKTIITPEKKRLQLPIITFESSYEYDHFKIRWN